MLVVDQLLMEVIGERFPDPVGLLGGVFLCDGVEDGFGRLGVEDGGDVAVDAEAREVPEGEEGGEGGGRFAF